MRERGAGFYHGLAIAAVVIWGTTFVSTKVLLTEGLRSEEHTSELQSLV